MPGYDTTGPRGEGPGTGRSRGRCGVSRRRGKAEGVIQPPWWLSTPESLWSGLMPGVAAGWDETSEREVRFLAECIVYLQEELETIKKRVADMDKQT